MRANSVRHLNNLLDRRYRSEGSVEGIVERFSGTGNDLSFTIADALDRYPVDCRHDASLAGIEQVAVGSRVRVAGEVERGLEGRPRLVDVAAVHLLPNPELLPRPHDIRGIDPDATNGQPVADWLRRRRG